MTEEYINKLDDVLELIDLGERNRKIAATKLNHFSSRSHTLFRVYIQSFPDKDNINDTDMMESMLNFVDLAGSERMTIHDDETKEDWNKLTRETKSINKSLHTLNKIIQLKSEGAKVIPYRESP